MSTEIVLELFLFMVYPPEVYILIFVPHKEE